MLNKSCIHCKQPMNGGVFRKPNQCPHCMSWQDQAKASSSNTSPSRAKATLENQQTSNAALAARKASSSATKKVATKKPTAGGAAKRVLTNTAPVSYTHLTLPTIYSV